MELGGEYLLNFCGVEEINMPEGTITFSTIDGKQGPVVLKKNCRIGSHSTIMPGVTIGENAIVGAHSFVNRDVGDGEVVVGVPAGGRR